MGGKITKLNADIGDIEKRLIEGVGILSHDLFWSIVVVKENHDQRFTITIPHYFDDQKAIKDNAELRKAILDSPERQIIVLLRNAEIEYQNGSLLSKFPFASSLQEVKALLRNLKHVNYKDSGFITALIDNDGNCLQSPTVVVGFFGKLEP